MKTTKPFTPIQYLIGSVDFCGYSFNSDSRALIPRPETELLVETVISLARNRQVDGPVRILDLCTGSGNIAISLARRLWGLTNEPPKCTITASDISPEALSLAIENARKNGVDGQIEFVLSDLFADITGEFDLIVSNPPYIAGYEFAMLQQEVLMEPRIALYGGEDGLDFYRAIIASCRAHASDDSYLIFEIGYAQKDRVCDIIESEGGFDVAAIAKDFAGIDRVITARWKSL